MSLLYSIACTGVLNHISFSPLSSEFSDSPSSLVLSHLNSCLQINDHIYMASENAVYDGTGLATSILRRVISHFIFNIALKSVAGCTKLSSGQNTVRSLFKLRGA